MMFDQLSQRLEGVKPYKPSKPAILKSFRSRCPSCGGSTTKLNASLKTDGDILIFCHGGCDVIAIVGSIGLNISDLFGKTPHSANALTSSKISIKGWDWWSLVSALDHLSAELTQLTIELTGHLPLNAPARLVMARGISSVKDLAEKYQYGKKAGK